MTKLKGKSRAKASKQKKNKQKNSFFLKRKELIRGIRTYDDPILAKKCEVVNKDEDVSDIFKKMEQSLNATKNGVGLAANQIGITKRLVVIKPDSDSKEITRMINPEIISHSDIKKFGREGCLSYPGVYGMVERYTSVKISYYDEEWKKHIIEYKEGNILGIIVQHEISHTFGLCEMHNWWKDPEGMQKKLEERFNPKEETNSEVVKPEEVIEVEA